MIIASNQNPRFKAWKKLLTKKGRRASQTFLIEGEHQVQTALQLGWPVVELILTENYQLPSEWVSTYSKIIENKVLISQALFAEIAETSTPQGIAAIVRIPERITSFSEQLVHATCILLVDRVQDPGNLGTIIRTADAAGADALILGEGTVDPYAGKVLRSTQGSIFHLPIIERNLEELIPELVANGWKVLGTALEGAVDYRKVQLRKEEKIALLIGNEAQGVSQELLRLTSENIKIPIWGQAESLNVAIATGILLYHLQAQRKAIEVGELG